MIISAALTKCFDKLHVYVNQNRYQFKNISLHILHILCASNITKFLVNDITFTVLWYEELKS